MFEIYMEIDNKWDQINVEDYLKMNINYHWIDLIRISFEYNISLQRLIDKLIKNGGLPDINKEAKKIVVKYFDNKLWELRDITVNKI